MSSACLCACLHFHPLCASLFDHAIVHRSRQAGLSAGDDVSVRLRAWMQCLEMGIQALLPSCKSMSECHCMGGKHGLNGALHVHCRELWTAQAQADTERRRADEAEAQLAEHSTHIAHLEQQVHACSSHRALLHQFADLLL